MPEPEDTRFFPFAHRLVPADIDRLHPLDAGVALEQATRLPSWILLTGDRASMSQGVEARVPFLDHEIVEFVASLPPSLKMRGFTEKSVLRGAMGPLLPEVIRDRQKRPFFTPINDWFFTDAAPDVIRESLSPAALKDSGIFHPETVSRFLREIKIVPKHNLLRSRLEWTLILILGTQMLHHQFVRRRCESPPEEWYPVGRV